MRTAHDKLRLLERALELDNVSRACAELGFSRDSYYRLRRRHAELGPASLEPLPRRAPLFKNRLALSTELAVLELSRAAPDRGQAAVAAALRERGVAISAAGVRRVWLRHGIQTSALRRAWCATR